MDRGNADQRGGQLDLEHAGIDVREPFRLVGMAGQIQPRDEGFVAADDDHDQQIGDHHHVDQAEHDQHHLGFAEIADLGNQDRQFVHELIDIYALREDQAEIQRRL